MNILSVSSLNEQIKNLLESHFMEVYVEGEVSRPTYHTSGHLYFSLKDQKSVVKCVMFRSSLARVPFRVEDGQQVVVYGKIGVYKPRGEYQLYAYEIHPAGVGALQLAFEQLKKKLQAKGYFDKKRPLPAYIYKIALVTSKTGAALQDMLRVLQKRWPLVRVFVVDTLVQGKSAATDIARAVRQADSLGADVIVVGRGGGSIEDLWAFNEEIVAEAIYQAKTPVVSAVGHEIDYVISDFVADMRAPTPSAAIEMIVPDMQEELMRLDALMEQFFSRENSILTAKAQELSHIQNLFTQASPFRQFALYKQKIEALKSSFAQAIALLLHRKQALVPNMKIALENAMTSHIVRKENTLVMLSQKYQMALKAKEPPFGTAQILKNSKPAALKDIEVGDTIELEDLHYKLQAKIIKKDAL